MTQTGTCLQVLSTGKKFQGPTLNWQATPTPVAIGNGWSTFIANSKPKLCGITSCQLLHSDCKTLLHGPDQPLYIQNNNKESSNPPFTIMSNQTSLFGYTNKTFCLQCSNKEESMVGLPFSTSQTSKCATTLKSKTTPYKQKTIAFKPNALSDAVISNGWTDFFTNTDQTNCPVLACDVFAQGCRTHTTQASIWAMNNNLTFSLFAKNSNPLGYSQTVCLGCKNGESYPYMMFDNISVI